MARSPFVSVAAAVVTVGLSAPALAQTTTGHLGLADGFDLQQLTPAPAGDRFFGVADASVGRGPVYAQVLGNYAYRTLRVHNIATGTYPATIASSQLYAHLGVAVPVMERVLFHADVPFALTQSGDSLGTVSAPSGGKLADMRLGARVAVLGKREEPLSVAVGLDVWLPTGSKADLTGDGAVRAAPKLEVGGRAGAFVYSGNAGVLFRRHLDLGLAEIGNAITLGAAAGVLAWNDKLQIGPELYGDVILTSDTRQSPVFGKRTAPVEGLLGAKAYLGDFVVGAAIGAGFSIAPGTPAARGLLSFGYAPGVSGGDRDKDGIGDFSDACPDVAGPRNADPNKNGCRAEDRDADGVVEGKDNCPDLPGVADASARKNGCPPEPDRDGDGIVDKLDACIDVPGAQSPDPKKNGCPARDRDNDGIADDEDACPDVPGIPNEMSRRNGCPLDTDGDKIPDDKDACPKEKGEPSKDPAKNGCPSSVRMVGDEIVILQQVQFDTGKSTIKPISSDLLDQVAAVMKEHPEIVKLQVGGHTDNKGGSKPNKKLSQGRAEAVMAALVTRGIDASRLQAMGFGQDQPLGENDTEEGRSKNRRVEFKILERSTK